MQDDRSRDLARTALQLLALAVLIAATFWILRPFLIALVWATMIAVATWPVLLRVQGWLGGRRGPAVALMTLVLLLVLVVPLYFGIDAIVDNARRIADWSQSLGSLSLPPLPAWIQSLPFVGAKLVARWQQLVDARPEDLAARLAPYGQTLVRWFVGQVGSVGVLLLQFLLTVVISAILYTNGETAVRGLDRFAQRLAGQQGVNAVHLGAQAIRGVALGVVATATLQTLASGIGVALAGVPFATILIAVIFMLCIAQVGPGLVLIPAVIWVYSARGGAWGTGFLIWSIFCGTFDNFLRPVLIRRGADLPLLLIFSGVIGGLVAFGIIGLFIGPVVLAVAYTLLADWVSTGEAQGPGGAEVS
jgi:predicted PurR-regulated permease PerM